MGDRAYEIERVLAEFFDFDPSPKESKRFEKMSFVEDHYARMDSPPCYCTWTNKWCVLMDAEWYAVEGYYMEPDGVWGPMAERVVNAIKREVERGNFTAEYDEAMADLAEKGGTHPLFSK